MMFMKMMQITRMFFRFTLIGFGGIGNACPPLDEFPVVSCEAKKFPNVFSRFQSSQLFTASVFVGYVLIPFSDTKWPR